MKRLFLLILTGFVLFQSFAQKATESNLKRWAKKCDIAYCLQEQGNTKLLIISGIKLARTKKVGGNGQKASLVNQRMRHILCLKIFVPH